MVKLVIFDLDGTLLNTVEDLGHAVNHALRQLGFSERPMEEYKILCGRGIANLLKGALPEEARTEENCAAMARLFYPRYRSHIADCTRPYPGIPELLETLDSQGICFAVASNKYQEGAEYLVRHFFGRYTFVRILGQQEGLPLKPDPALVDLVLAAAPEEVLYVGDSNVDMQTGLNAGLRTVGVTWGFRSREELAAYNPWLIADSPEDIWNAIKPASA